MELIVGNKRVTVQALRRIPGGIEAQLVGEALTSVLDATFRGGASIEVIGGDLDHHALDVTDIRMEDTLEDLGLDSLGLLESIFAIEEAFDISVPFNANEPGKSEFDISSVAAIIAAVEGLVSRKAA